MIPRLRNKRILTLCATLLIVLVVSSLFIKSGEHNNAIERAKEWHQNSVCEPATEKIVHQVKTEIKREVLVDRYNNRIACDLCQPGDVFCETVG
jgi:molybdopterin biosynthesis enzyme MoaB